MPLIKQDGMQPAAASRPPPVSLPWQQLGVNLDTSNEWLHSAASRRGHHEMRLSVALASIGSLLPSLQEGLSLPLASAKLSQEAGSLFPP